MDNKYVISEPAVNLYTLFVSCVFALIFFLLMVAIIITTELDVGLAMIFIGLASLTAMGLFATLKSEVPWKINQKFVDIINIIIGNVNKTELDDLHSEVVLIMEGWRIKFVIGFLVTMFILSFIINIGYLPFLILLYIIRMELFLPDDVLLKRYNWVFTIIAECGRMWR